MSTEKNTEMALAGQLIAGLKKHFSKWSPLPQKGKRPLLRARSQVPLPRARALRARPRTARDDIEVTTTRVTGSAVDEGDAPRARHAVAGTLFELRSDARVWKPQPQGLPAPGLGWLPSLL
jgi:hypothetical protein